MGIFRRKRRESAFAPPPPPPLVDPSTVDDAQRALEAVESRDEEIEAGHARIMETMSENALGPRFWAAIGGQSG